MIDVRDNLTHRPLDFAHVSVIVKNDSINFNRTSGIRGFTPQHHRRVMECASSQINSQRLTDIFY